jgi:4-amino-4-deoxy-L-arabinose transferase-like glycosyltransferase
LGLLGALTLLRLLVAAVAPLAPDEAYYWVWSRALALGYYDHPPMVALWIWAGTHLAGDGALGIRLFAPLSAALGSWMLAQASADVFPARNAGTTAVLLLNATLLFGVGAVTMTPDTPLLFFWTACLWAVARLHRTGSGAWWLVAGVAAGLAMDSKYTAILLPFGLALWCFLLPGPRAWLFRPAPWCAAALGLLSFLPVLWWNAAHDWVSFAKQGGRSFVWNPLQALRYEAELLGGQAGLATPLVFMLCLGGMWACLRATARFRLAPEGLVVAFTVPPILLFLQHATGDRVQANWPAIVYPAAVIAVAALGERWQRWVKPAVIFGSAMTLLVYLQGTLHPFPLSPRIDPTARVRIWGALDREIGQIAAAQGATFVAADNYGEASELARSHFIHAPVIGIGRRWSFFRLPDARAVPKAGTGLLVVPAGRDLDGSADLIAQVDRSGGIYNVYRIAAPPQGAILPRPWPSE